MNNHFGKRHVDGLLEKISKHAAGKYGFVSRLAEEMTRISGKKWSRQHISVLVTSTKKNRVEPLWSTGILLERAYKNLTEIKMEDGE